MEIDVGDDYVELIHNVKIIRQTTRKNGKEYPAYICSIPKEFLGALIADPTHAQLYEGKYFGKIRSWDTLELFHASQIVGPYDFSFQVPTNSNKRYPFTIRKPFFNRFSWKYEELYNHPLGEDTPLVARVNLCFTNNGTCFDSHLYITLEVGDDENDT